MNIVVCLKQVPDVEGRVVVEKGVLSVKALVPAEVTSSLDVYALEEGLSLRDRAGGNVTVISAGKPEAEECLRRGIALGADNAVMIADPGPGDRDAFTTAHLLARAIAAMPHDVVLCGQRSDDMRGGLVGVVLAQLLGLASVANVIQAEPLKGFLRLTRKLEKGNRETVECDLPALLTIEAGEKKPRHATIKGVLRSRQTAIEKLSLAELGLTPEDVTNTGKVKVLNITPPKPKMKGLFIPDTKASAAAKMAAIMGGGLVQKKSNLLEGDPEKIAQQVVQFLKKEKLAQG